jgi:Family of unknown function (DUF5686)/CarboxypepD_reg-like domain
MLKKLLGVVVLMIVVIPSIAGRISGSVTDDKNAPLPFASILVKGTTTGTSANSEGKYFLNLQPGKYTIICQYIGYTRVEKEIVVGEAGAQLDFQLTKQQLSLAEVVVKRGEDPAYEIIRKAIKKRPYYLSQIKTFQCDVYLKGLFKMRNHPKKFMGQKVDFEDGDTSKRKTLYLSESFARYSVQQPNNSKIEVLSTKVSGQSDGFGFASTNIVSFYENNISFGAGLNPRGFISPIANGALNFYKYKYEGSFFEDGREINKIKVTPRRKYEPLFSGYINIVDNDWRIHSLELQLTKESQMELVDTLTINQLYVPLNKDIWVIKNQVIYPAIKIFGFDMTGSFLNVYSAFNLSPKFDKKFFDNTVLKYYDSSNKRSAAYWDTIRPIALQKEEIADYKKKDSLEEVRKSPAYMDSLDRRRNKVSVTGLIFIGQTFSKEKKRASYSIDPIQRMISHNTVEGFTVNFHGQYFKRLDSSSTSRRSIRISPTLRYGFANGRFNPRLSVTYNWGKEYFNSLSIAGGKRVLQFNNAGPVDQEFNTYSTLLWERNFLKTYEAWFGRISYSKGFGEGLTVGGSVQYQDRTPLMNKSGELWRDYANRVFTPNYPVELVNAPMDKNQVLIASISLSWQPGARYIELPGRKFNIGSKYPRFLVNYTKGVNNILGSDTDFDKWRFTVSDNLNLKLKGTFSYNLSIGGFINAAKVQIPDFQHFNGNQMLFAGPYMNTFQLASYYQNSTTAKFYSAGHVEHHFNGLLTNKIPLFRRLNWHLVAASNAFYVNKNNNYFEISGGIENIFKIVRLDFIQSFQAGSRQQSGIRIGISGIGFRRGSSDD